MKKYLFMMLVLLLYATTAVSQTVTVVDQETQQPLEGVNIFTQDRSLAQVTNSNGQAPISTFQGKENIIFSYVGYERATYSYEQILEMGNRIGLVQKPLTMSNIVVSASRWEQDSRETPISIARVTPDDIKLQNPQTAADLLGVSNEVFIQKSQMGGGSPMIRGFATNRVLLVVDGVRMNNAIFRGGNLQNVISLDANAIENTEITFGPGSVLYGSDAIGGVMSFSTITPRFSFTDEPMVDGSFLTRVSSANWERTGHFDLNLGFENWASVTSVTYTNYDDMRMGKNGPNDYLRQEFVRRVNGQDMVLDNDRATIQKQSGYSQLNLMQKFRFRPDENWDLRAGIHYSTTTDLPRYDRLIQRQNNGQFSNAEWYYGPQQWFMSSLTASYNAETTLFDRVKTTAAFQDYEESRNDRDFQDPNRRNRNEQVRAYSLNLDFEKSLNETSNLTYGLEGVINTVHSDAQVKNINTGAISPTSSRYPDGSTWQSYAAFAKYTNNLSDQWTITAGSRYNRYIIDASFSWSLWPQPFPLTMPS
ncbi:MAG: TonB-dependent receptor plug domain-containing protein [Balneolaceae bacterium]|nr:TonB-dependent receptor plug domain-containing protein [Balneolaceae bacterium]